MKDRWDHLQFAGWSLLLISSLLAGFIGGLTLVTEPGETVLDIFEKRVEPRYEEPLFSVAGCMDVNRYRPARSEGFDSWRIFVGEACLEAAGASSETTTFPITSIPPEWEAKWTAKEDAVRQRATGEHRRAVWLWRVQWIVLPLVTLLLGFVGALLGLRGVVRNFIAGRVG